MIARVVFFNSLRKVFDYLIPEDISSIVTVGLRVKVPFGSKSLIGFIVDISEFSSVNAKKLKYLEELIDPTPLLDPILYQTVLWAANYYKHSIGAILDGVLPKYLKENRTVKHIDNLADPKLSITYNNLNNSLEHSLDNTPDNNLKLQLNSFQQYAINNILAHTNKFNVNLIEGVTGSGKTEVYLQLSAKILEMNKQILILVPEIGLTPQTWQRFTNRFKKTEVVVLHSKLTPKQRSLNWYKASKGIAKIILGTRTAAFVPLMNPGLFIIDEEHDLSFKQHQHVSYHARDFLIMRAKYSNCQVILGSATPSLESVHNVLTLKYSHYQLPQRAISNLPTINIVDTRNKPLKFGISAHTINIIKQRLAAQQQVLLFINRRGFAPVLQCSSCNWIYKCVNCDANMIWHIYTDQLQCHHCYKNVPVSYICGKCSQPRLIPIGQGTERIELALNKLFPQAKIARIDRDSATNKKIFAEILNKILQQQVNLLIGTQMMAKGHHFPNLGLVVIIDIDHGFFSNDFRSTERLGQLILQVAGRAGRESKGEVLLETSLPNHPLLLALQQHDYKKFCNILLQERKKTKLPPFSYQILWKAEAKLMKNCINFLQQIKHLANSIMMKRTEIQQHLKSFGPFPANMEKRKNKFHARLLFQSIDRNKLQQLHDLIIAAISNNGLDNVSTKVQWIIDVDPQEF